MNWNKVGLKILYPPIWVVVVFAFFSAAALIFVFLNGLDNSVLGYVSYVFSFYSLTVLSACLVKNIPVLYNKVKNKIYSNPFGLRYLSDAVFRTEVSLTVSLCCNFLYVCVNIVSFFLYHSYWFVCLGVYYATLAVMRFILARFSVKFGIGEYRKTELRYTLACAFILLTLNFALSGTILMILYQNKGFDHGEIMIYIVATYTFFITVKAIVNFIKYRKYNSPVMTMTKVVSLSAAFVSILSLETAMLSQFGADLSPENRWMFVALTGAGVSLIIISLAVYMIVKAFGELKKIKAETDF